MRHVLVAVCLALLGGGSTALAQQPSTPAGAHTVLSADTLKWGPAPPGLPAGAQVTVLNGDPAVAGEIFTLRIKMPAGYKVPPHWHPGAEHITLLSGQLMVGMGDTFDTAKMQAMSAGSFATMPKEMRHYVQAKGPVILQLHAVGPFAITYVNPADDPRGKTN